MRILVLADIDDLRWQHGPGEVDLIISLGDISDCLILEAWEAFGAPMAFGIRGNHDPATPFPEGISDLHLKTVEFGGLRFAGFCGSARYRPRRSHMFEQHEVAALMKDFPKVDIFVAHNSPTMFGNDDGIHDGFVAFDQYIHEKLPRYFFFGHQHRNIETTIGLTKVVGIYGHRVLKVDIT